MSAPFNADWRMGPRRRPCPGEWRIFALDEHGEEIGCSSRYEPDRACAIAALDELERTRAPEHDGVTFAAEPAGVYAPSRRIVRAPAAASRAAS